jgi:hypothetical protein
MARSLPVLSLILLPLGCWSCGGTIPLLRTTDLAGDTAGLRRFEGRWFDENGNLMAVISSPPEPRLSVRPFYELEPKDARLQDGQIVFDLGSGPVFLRLTGEDEVLVSLGREAPDEPSSCSCSDAEPFPALVLVRNPPPEWLMKQAVRKTSEITAHFARKAYDGTWNWLARVL